MREVLINFFSSFARIPDSFLWIFFLLSLIVFLVFSLILNYHWRRAKTLIIKKGRSVYFIGGFILILISFISLIIFINSK